MGRYNAGFFCVSFRIYPSIMRVFRGFHRLSQLSLPAALSIGNFDGMHCGHEALFVRLIKEARRMNLAAVIMTFEPHPREFFAPDSAPARLSSLREKLEAFARAGVDEVCVVRFNHALATLGADAFAEEVISKGLRTRHIVIGDDFRFGAGRLGDFPGLQAAGRALDFSVEAMETVWLNDLRVSSSAVRKALAAGNFALAEALLGRPYAISGRVTYGKALGRKLGFPTANLVLRRAFLPMRGVFAVRVVLPDGSRRTGVAHMGARPSLKHDEKPVLETHLFDFSGDLYEARLKIEFAAKLREIIKFPNLSALQAQIAEDAKAARIFFNSF